MLALLSLKRTKMKVTNYLLGYKDLYIVQDTDMFNFSLDSVLLPNFVSLTKDTKKIMDIGCGNAPIPLILSTKTKADIVGVEIQKDVFDLGCESVKMNHLDKQITLINGDINEVYRKYDSCSFDLITCNPPFFKYQKDSNVNDNDYKTLARHEKTLTLEQIMTIAKYLLTNNGTLALVHRPNRLIDIITLMRKNNIEPKRMRLVYPHPDSEANILLIEGRKNGRAGLKIYPPLYSHTANGEYTDEIKKMFENN